VQVAPFRHGMVVHGVITGELIKEPVITNWFRVGEKVRGKRVGAKCWWVNILLVVSIAKRVQTNLRIKMGMDHHIYYTYLVELNQL
jgi:hypothetical protein